MSRQFSTQTRIGQQMAALGWTATEFATATGIHPRTLTELLSGRVDPTVNQIIVIADTLGVRDTDII